MRHAAIISISNQFLLNMLDFKGGIIHRVFMDDEFLAPTSFNMVVEHPDLDEIPDHERLPYITPIMESNFGEDGSLLSVHRTNPPHLSGSQIDMEN